MGRDALKKMAPPASWAELPLALTVFSSAITGLRQTHVGMWGLLKWRIIK